MTDNLQQFIQSATEFCTLIDRVETMLFARFIEQSASLLAWLYHNALDLPDIELNSEDDVARLQTYENLAKSLSEVFSTFNMYRVPVHAYLTQSLDDTVSYGLLSDDFADIYLDLKSGLNIYDESPKLAVWHWRFSFQMHWGAHASNALWASNRLRHEQHLTA